MRLPVKLAKKRTAPLPNTRSPHYGSYQMPWLYMAAVLLIVAVIRGICTSNKRKFKG